MSSFGDEWIWGICLTVAIHLLKGSLYFPCPFFPLGFPSLTIGFPEENPNNLTYILLFFFLCVNEIPYRRTQLYICSPRVFKSLFYKKWDHFIHTYLQIAFLTQQYCIEIPLSLLVES